MLIKDTENLSMSLPMYRFKWTHYLRTNKIIWLIIRKLECDQQSFLVFQNFLQKHTARTTHAESFFIDTNHNRKLVNEIQHISKCSIFSSKSNKLELKSSCIQGQFCKHNSPPNSGEQGFDFLWRPPQNGHIFILWCCFQ